LRSAGPVMERGQSARERALRRREQAPPGLL
jgi:hypothetical protein